jgi:hypothetical protein
MTIIWPSNTPTIIDSIRGAIGRETIWYTTISSAVCHVCGIDPVTNTALDSFCPTCSGIGYLYTYSGTSITGHVTWGFSEHLGWTAGGQLYEGDCRVQVKNTPRNVTVIENVEWVDVDGKDMQIVKKILRGVPTVNRILVDLMERNKDA